MTFLKFLSRKTFLAALCVFFKAAVAHADPVTISGDVVGKGIILGLGTYEAGTQITLRAVPQVDWKFDHWEGVTGELATNNLLTIAASAGLQPQAVMIETPGAGRFQGGKVVAWGDNSYRQINVAPGLSNVVAIAGDENNSVALKMDGTAVSWGINQYGTTNIPSGLTDVVAIAAGSEHSVALKRNGTVVAWGYNEWGQTQVPTELSNVVAIAAGQIHTVALRMDGTVVAWGANNSGQTAVPMDLRGVIAVAGGGAHTVALKRDGSVVAWGNNTYGQANTPPRLSSVVSIAAGLFHTLALKQDGTVIAWGAGEPGNVSYYDVGQSTLPVGLSKVIAIAAGERHSVALKENGTVVAWGDNSSGQTTTPLGLNGVVAIAAGYAHTLALKTDRVSLVNAAPAVLFVEAGGSLELSPTIGIATTHQWYRDSAPVAGVTNVFLKSTSMSLADAGRYQLLAINGLDALLTPPTEVVVYTSEVSGLGHVDFRNGSDPGTLIASAVAGPTWKLDHWEGDLSGTNLNQTVVFNDNKLAVLAKAVFVPTGKVTIAATVSGEGIVLGSGTFDERREITLRAVPQVDWIFDHWEGVPSELATNNPLTIEASIGLEPQAMMIETIGSGRFRGGRVVAWGNNEYNATSVPSDLSGVVAIAAGQNLSVALKSDGTVAAWGDYNDFRTNVPAGLNGVRAIAAGGAHTAALKTNGTVVIWGWGGPDQDKWAAQLRDVTAIAAGYQSALALKQDGTVAAWPENTLYGEGTVPPGLKGVAAIAAGGYHSFALKQDGTEVGWGYNFFGENTVPPGLDGVVTIAPGGQHIVALKRDGTVVAWGRNDSHQTNVPPGLSGVVGIGAGPNFSAALKRDGTVVAWGSADYNQLKVPIGLSGVTAIAPGDTHTLALRADRLGLVSGEGSLTVREAGQSFGFAPFIVLATSYQWYRDGHAIPAATSNIFEVVASSLSDSGSYQLLAMNFADALLTPPFVLKVLPVGRPQLQVDGEVIYTGVIRGDSSTLVLSTSFSNGTIQYTFDGSPPGFDSPTYTVPVKVTNTVIVRALAYSSDFTQTAELSPIIVRIVPTHQLIATTSGGVGQVSFNPAKSRYLEDEVVTIKALPSAGNGFVRWEGAVSGSYPEQQVVMSADKQVQAIFALIPKFALTTTVAGGGFIKGNTSSPYYVGTTLSLQAVSSNGWRFLQWQGDVIANDTNATVLMDAAKTVSAVFATDLALSVAGAGHLQFEPSSGPYPYGSKVRLTPVPNPGNYLALWGSVVAGQPKTAIEVTITNASMLVSAIFAPLPTNKFTITAVAGSGGKVSSSPADGAYINGQIVTLTAQPDLGFEFVGWSGDVIDTANPLSVIANANKTIQASFRRTGGGLFTLTTTFTGQGRIARTPDLGGYEAGAQVILEAIPPVNWAFGSWNDSTTTNPRRVITISSNTAIAATFLPKYILATETSGEGTVLLSPPDGTYVAGTVVTATANPASGSGFVGWSGDLDNTAPQATLTMTGNKRIVATFARLGTLTTLVKGSGTVTRDPIQDQYLPGSIVQLTAIAAAGYQFSGWSGAASGTANPLSFKVDKATAVIANFADIAAPVITIESPIAGSTNDERFVLSGMASDNSGAVQCTWQWDDVDQGDLVLSSGRFGILGLHLHPGDNHIRVIAKDAAGNQASADRLITWAPLRTVAVRDAVEVQEGKRMDFAVELESGGDVGSMNLLLHYDPVFLAEPEWTWSSIAGSSINTLTTNVPGEVRATFSLAGGSVPAGTQLLAMASFRARSVPTTVTTILSCDLVDSADPQGNKFSFGSAAIAGSGRILPRRMLGDNNANNRLDIGDCTLIQRLLTGLSEVRAWDVTANDLNASGDLDSGDATKALRIVVGLDSPPAIPAALQRSEFKTQSANTSPEKALLLANPSQPSVGGNVTIQVGLTNIPTALSGVSFRLNYATNALRLTGSSSLSAGDLVPSSARVLWNVLPNQSNFGTQNGGVLAGLSTATEWPVRNGALAQFEFQVQPGFTSQATWPIKVSNLEITGDGFDTRILSDAAVSVTNGTVVPPNELRMAQPAIENGQLKFHAIGTAGVHALIQSSADAKVWGDGEIIQIPAGGIDQSIPIPPGAPKMFYRLKQAP